ncbi:hypothetical protein S225a_19760 [Candidatus Brocadiaceae bacterium S225]|uniref:Uncharacterized protein n=1 Tax=Candidatus Scalindua brodae TaxID=237368 RepID=A0A0B0EGZ1_9BACT|nr:MAG: hypothetical protein SCABRO_02419 [Candidatus Scalindua brodae]TWU31893.1 hypothetical protein S225a_19760 [Candidatus Brocadiaceae bacterium S225]
MHRANHISKVTNSLQAINIYTKSIKVQFHVRVWPRPWQTRHVGGCPLSRNNPLGSVVPPPHIVQRNLDFLRLMPELRSTLKMLSAPMICSPRLRRPNRCSSTPALAPPKAGRTFCVTGRLWSAAEKPVRVHAKR